MVGGDDGAVRAVMPLLTCMGKNISHLGSAGSGQHCKMVNQILIASGMVGMCEGLVYGRAAGLPLEAVISAVSTGAAGSWSVSNLGPRVLRGNYEPGFFVEHFIKDLRIALQEADRMNLSVRWLRGFKKGF